MLFMGKCIWAWGFYVFLFLGAEAGSGIVVNDTATATGSGAGKSSALSAIPLPAPAVRRCSPTSGAPRGPSPRTPRPGPPSTSPLLRTLQPGGLLETSFSCPGAGSSRSGFPLGVEQPCSRPCGVQTRGHRGGSSRSWLGLGAHSGRCHLLLPRCKHEIPVLV